MACGTALLAYQGSSFRSGSDVPLESRLSTFIKGSIYENAGTALVVVNAVFIGWQVQHFAKTHTSLAFRMPVEITFATLFLLEFLGKVYAWRWKLFDKGAHDDLYWNVFDLFVVSFMWLTQACQVHGQRMFITRPSRWPAICPLNNHHLHNRLLLLAAQMCNKLG